MDATTDRYAAIKAKLTAAFAKAEEERLEEIARKERAQVALQEAFERVALLTLDANIHGLAHTVADKRYLISSKLVGNTADLNLVIDFHKKRVETSPYTKMPVLRVSIPLESEKYSAKLLVIELINENAIVIELCTRLPGSDLQV